MNKEKDYKYSHILNGDITVKKETLKQIQMNNRKEKKKMNSMIQLFNLLIQ